MIVEETTPNFQTNFKPEEIILTFDEWVELDPKQEILISPPLELGEDNRPVLNRRSLVIPLQGLELRDSVTYVVNIGSAIKDLNEGNPTENLRFVFATGPVLDSASVSGTLVRDFTGEPIENAVFTLYSNLADTAVTTGNPTYFAQTDEEGKFTVFNIRPGIYRAVALERNPSATNYFIDISGFAQPLAIGFKDSLLTVTDGTNQAGVLQLSTVPRQVKLNGVDTTDLGRIKLSMNQPAERVDLVYSGNYLRRNDKDTINLFYRELQADSIFFGQGTAIADTLYLPGILPTSGNPLQAVSTLSGRLNPTLGANYSFNRPLESLDTSLIILTKDTFVDRVPFTFVIDPLYPGNLRINAKWEASVAYQLEMLPGALTDWSGGTNPDTLFNKTRVDAVDKYGILRLSVLNLDSTANYILRLIEKDEPIVRTQRYVTSLPTFEVEYTGLNPATYQVEIILDRNKNGRYDTGDFFTMRQPEVVRRFELEALRANWEVEEIIDLKE
ncbi:MAG: hypothetical protein ACJAZ9_001146 [Neolewinella sp.]|jgi:hypothetical protein